MSNSRAPQAAPTWDGTEGRVVRICERIYDTWFGHQGSSQPEIALSVIAAFMLAEGINETHMLTCPDEEVVQGIREMWAWFWLRRPDLCQLCGPLANWTSDETLDPGLVRAIAATARAAVKAGICGLRGHLADTDLLGHAYTTMRPKAARGARGEFYSPAAICDTIGEMLVADLTFEAHDGPLRPGMSIAEPAAGTGGMVRAFANVLRGKNLDPAGFWWVVNDVSPLVVAALAVNCHVWGLGPNVVIGVADTLAEPDWPDRAWETARAAVAERDQMFRAASLLALLKSLDRAGGLAASEPEPEPDPISGPVPSPADVDLPSAGTLFDIPPATTPGGRGHCRKQPRQATSPAPSPTPTETLF